MRRFKQELPYDECLHILQKIILEHWLYVIRNRIHMPCH